MAASVKEKRGRVNRPPHSHGRQGSSSSSSSLDDSYLCDDGLHQQTSLWKKQHLEKLGIFYNDKISATREILHVLKRQVADLGMDAIPEIGQKLIELMKQVFTFTFNFNDYRSATNINLRQLHSEMDKMSTEFESHLDDFKSRNHDLLQDRKNDRIYQTWVIYASEFLTYLRIFIQRYGMLETREGTFAQLLKQFTRVCLLVPECGESSESHLTIKGRSVSGIPDVRFPSHGDKTVVKLVTIANVEKSSAFKGDMDIFHIENLPDGILGQHGVELLLETAPGKSFFGQAVSGLISVGTKLIFTVLEMDLDQYASLHSQADDLHEEDKKSTILYTKPYDYMNNDERNEILEICFWLGYVQHDAYKSVIQL